MGWGFQRFFCLFTLQALVIIQCAPSSADAIGVVYGYDANNLPLPSQVVQLLTTNFVTQVRIYDYNPVILKAFEGSNVELIVGIPNNMLTTVGASNATANSWLVSNILPYTTSVNITGIAVGDEVFTTFPSFGPHLAQTMTWIHSALIVNGLAQRIRVSTPFSTELLQSSFPPSQSIFNQSLVSDILPVLQFLNLTGADLFVNVRAYEVFQTNSAAVTLNYALFQPDEPTLDTYTGLQYFSLFDALVDATYAAMKTMGFTTVLITVSETGWPSVGDSNEYGANVSNAQTYNNNLVVHVRNNTGTPAMPRIPINTYVYELFNENLQLGPTSTRNYGLFQYNLTPVYNVDLTGNDRALTANGTEYQTWCLAVQGATLPALQAALDWACGQGGVNCTAISQGGTCYIPDTLPSHASWAFNSYYQAHGNAPNTCSFNGAAVVVSSNPSYGSCVFQASNVTSTVNGPPANSNNASTFQFQTAVSIGCLAMLFILNFKYTIK